MANAGIDTIRTSLVSYTLKGNVENLVYTGSGASAASATASTTCSRVERATTC